MRIETARPENSGRIVLLTSEGPLAGCVANGLIRRFGNLSIIQEKPERKFEVLKRRARLLGWPIALSQVLCAVVLKLMEFGSKGRRAEICQEFGLDAIFHRSQSVMNVPSVNSDACQDLLRKLDPAVIAVYGTRVIRRETLQAVNAPFINYHAGINPKYRGQQPAYWALAKGDAKNAGVTVHLVDTGIDTGDILYQAPVVFDRRDTILTYQWAQLPAGLSLFERAIEDALHDRLARRRTSGPSGSYYPPTLLAYFRNGVVKGVW